MRLAMWLTVPVLFAFVMTAAVRAEAKSGQWAVTVGCAHCNYEKDTKAESCAAAAKLADGKIVFLKGDAMKSVKFREGGEYVVTGKMADDGKSIEVESIKKKQA